MIKSFLPDLVTAISDCVQPVSDQCLAKGLIPDSVYKRVLESGGTSEDKARTLILAVKTSAESDGRCLEILLNILDEQLPYEIRENLLSTIRKMITENANTCQAVITSPQSIQQVPNEQLPRESTTFHFKLLGRFEDSIRQHEGACIEKNLLEQRLQTKSEKYEKLKHELQSLKEKNQETSLIHDDIARVQSRISGCECKITNLKKKIEELQKIIEEQDMQAKRGRDMMATQTRNLFTLFAKHSQQQIEKAIKDTEDAAQKMVKEQLKLKEMQHQLQIQEKEQRIRELEVNCKSTVEVNPPDVLKPTNLSSINRLLRRHKSMRIHGTYKHRWRELGSKLGFSQQELDEIEEEEAKIPSPFKEVIEDKLKKLLTNWLQWFPRDSRGTTCFATYTQLKKALIDAGLGDVARDLPPYEQL